MQIDWITVAAQIVNFLVLVWLLQHFLYAPIIRAMDRREARIADRLEQARRKWEEAEEETERFRRKQAELDERRDRILAKARDYAEQERESLEHAAREEVDRRKKEWLEKLAKERTDFLRELRRRLVEHFYALARRALKDLASADLEAQIVNAFIDRLNDLDKDRRQKVAAACREAGRAITVESRFDLSANDKRRLTKAIHGSLFDAADVSYRETRDIACGIALKAGSQTIAWNLDSYLESIEDEVSKQIGGHLQVVE